MGVSGVLIIDDHSHLHQKTGKGFWIPWDADRNSPAKFIANSMIRDFMQDIDSLHTLLISDACFSGSLFVPGKSRSTEAMDSLARLKSRWAICSGRHDELVYDGKPGQNSPFASSIMETLRNYEGTALNAGLLADRVIRMTRANYRQLPIGNPIFEAGDCGKQFVFRRKTGPEDNLPEYLTASVRIHPEPVAPPAPTEERNPLLDIPPGPMVEGHLIDMSLVHAYARSFKDQKASFKIQEANSLRRKADKEGNATLIDEVDLPSPERSRPIDFWLDAFHQARLHGPRMLGALLLVADDQHFPPEARQARQTLLEKLRNGAYY